MSFALRQAYGSVFTPYLYFDANSMYTVVDRKINPKRLEAIVRFVAMVSNHERRRQIEER